MKNAIINFKKLIVFNKKMYIFILSLLLIGIITGSLFVTILKTSDKTLVLNSITDFFNNIKLNKLSNIIAFKNSIISNSLLITIIWILGISVIGIPVVILLILFKGFTLGFTLGTIILKYKIKGILISLLYIFPQIILILFLVIFVSYYSLSLSINIFKAIVQRKNLVFKEGISKYYLILLIGLLSALFISVIEAFVNPFILKLFSFLY